MRRPLAIMLVLMGGPVVTGAGAVLLSPLIEPPSPACRAAREAQSPEADALCPGWHRSSSFHFSSSGSSTRSGGSSSAGSSSTSATSSSTSVSRGGFGGSGAAAASGS